MEYKKLTDDELADFLQRACVQLVPELTQQLLSLGEELAEYRAKIAQGTLIDTEKHFIIEDEGWGIKNRYLICHHHIDTMIEDFCPTYEEAEKRLKELEE